MFKLEFKLLLIYKQAAGKEAVFSVLKTCDAVLRGIYFNQVPVLFKAMYQGGIKNPFLINFLATLQHKILTHKPSIHSIFNMYSQVNVAF